MESERSALPRRHSRDLEAGADARERTGRPATMVFGRRAHLRRAPRGPVTSIARTGFGTFHSGTLDLQMPDITTRSYPVRALLAAALGLCLLAATISAGDASQQPAAA